MADPTQLLAEATCVPTVKVRDRDGNSIGTIHAYMVGKADGRVSHAVLSLGGFMGMGKSFYPVPFDLLSYDAAKDRYTVAVARQVLEGGPSWANNAPLFDAPYADRVAGYYGRTAAPATVVPDRPLDPGEAPLIG